MALAQDIESRIQILDLVNRYVSTKNHELIINDSAHFIMKKPFICHISNQEYCSLFSCGKWWWPINFLMEIEKIDFREAVTILAKEAGIEMKTQFSVEQNEKWKDLYRLYKEATEWYHQALFLPENSWALTYLTDRKISIETIKNFKFDIHRHHETSFCTQKFRIWNGLYYWIWAFCVWSSRQIFRSYYFSYC